MPRTVLIMCLADPSGNPRPNRAIRLLSDAGYQVDLLGFAPKNKLPVRQIFPIKPLPVHLHGKILRRLRYWGIRLLQPLCPIARVKDALNNLEVGLLPKRFPFANHDYAVILVEDLQLLPFAYRIKGSARLLFDAREYYPEQHQDRWGFRVLERPERLRLCKTYLPLCDQVITVSPGLAEAYQRQFGIECQLLMSTPAYQDVQPRKTDPKRIRMVHHGVANRNRQIEKMVDIARLLDERFSLDLYLTANAAYIKHLKAYARDVPAVRICDPVPFAEIIPMLTHYDIGFYYLEPHGFNVTYNLPNKLFEFIQARLMVAIGPSPDMAGIVRQHACGIIADAFSVQSMAESLHNLDAAMVDRMKQCSHIAAEALCYEKEGQKLLNVIESSIGSFAHATTQ